MAQLKDLIVQGNSRFIGDIYGNYIHLDKQLHIDINQSTSATSDEVPLIVGQTNNVNLAIGRIGIQCRNNGAANTLYLNYHSGSIQFGSSTSLTAPTRIFGTVTPGADATYDLGTIDVLRWKNGFFTTALRVGPKDTTTSSTTNQNSYVGPEGFWQNQITAGTSSGYTLRGKGKDYAKLYVSTLGVANTPGIAILQLGNATASTAADNSNGTLCLYSNTTKYTSIKSSLEITGNHLNYLPVYSATGTSTYYGRLVGIYKGTTSGSTGFSDVGSTKQPVYITANGVATAIGYTIEKSVPSNAVFTDTNTKVNVTLATTTKAYLLGVSTTPTGTAQALTAISDTGVYLGTTAGTLVTTGKITSVGLDAGSGAISTTGNISGAAITSTSAVTVGSGYLYVKPYSSAYDSTGTDAGIRFYYNHDKSGVNADTLIANKSLQATTFYGSGAGLTALNGSNISTGTIDFARLPPSTKTFHYYNSSAVSTAHWITTDITASSTGTVWVRGRIFGSKGTNSPAIVVFAAAFVKINDPTDGTTSVTLNYWDPLGLFSSFNAAFDSNKKVYFQFKYSTRYSRIEAIINHDTVVANEIASISTTAPTVQATYSGTKVTS